MYCWLDGRGMVVKYDDWCGECGGCLSMEHSVSHLMMDVKIIGWHSCGRSAAIP